MRGAYESLKGTPIIKRLLVTLVFTALVLGGVATSGTYKGWFTVNIQLASSFSMGINCGWQGCGASYARPYGSNSLRLQFQRLWVCAVLFEGKLPPALQIIGNQPWVFICEVIEKAMAIVNGQVLNFFSSKHAQACLSASQVPRLLRQFTCMCAWHPFSFANCLDRLRGH